MGLWSGIKHALNGSLGTSDFQPLDKMLRTKISYFDESNFTSFDDIISTLPYGFVTGACVLYNNEIHIMGGNISPYNQHYKWNGSSWTSVSTLPYGFVTGACVLYNNEIHIMGGNISPYNQHYKWNGSSWTSVSTLPYDFYYGSAVVFNDSIHILGGGSNPTQHYEWRGGFWRNVSSLPYSFYQGCAVVYNEEINILGTIYFIPYNQHYSLGIKHSVPIYLNGKTKIKTDFMILTSDGDYIFPDSKGEVLIPQDGLYYFALKKEGYSGSYLSI